MSEGKQMRETVADVLDKDLPWLREDLLELADKILSAISPIIDECVGEDIFNREYNNIKNEIHKRLQERMG
jgi:hypothetical protein